MTVVILIIYEYAIAVEWSLVQNIKNRNRTNEIYNDQPFADRLDRSYFGFDQDYFERMPLLINSLQENNYVDSSLETSTPFPKKRINYNVTFFKTTNRPSFRLNPLRRTSPRPFYFEYRHPTPLPFSKTYGSRAWVERYRNEERLKNIRQIIKYLENTINAKVGDMHAKATEKQIAFTGLYIEPMVENKSAESYVKSDLQSASSNNLNKFHVNHLADPLFNFKPENPGDVNMLADDFFRFSPVPTPSLIEKPNKYPMFRQIPFQKRNCHGNKCEENKLLESASTTVQTEIPPLSTTKSFSVMLNLFPINAKTENKKQIPTTTQRVKKIYLTTARPLIQFKRKSNVSFKRIYTPYKRPRYLSKLLNKDSKINITTTESSTVDTTELPTHMVVHVKVYDEETSVKNITDKIYSTTFIPSTQTNPYTTRAPIEFSTSPIEDYHAGSSGYIPVTSKIDNSLPKVTTVIPFFDTTTEYWNAPTTQPADVIQFNAEDAKVPDHYLDLNKNIYGGDFNRRNSRDYIEHEKIIDDINTNERNLNFHEEASTLITKLKNDVLKKTTVPPVAVKETTTSVWTYVPQINGHYRSINQNSRNVNRWLNANLENDRKKRLEMSISSNRTYVPMYVEIKRNNTQISKDLNNEK